MTLRSMTFVLFVLIILFILFVLFVLFILFTLFILSLWDSYLYLRYIKGEKEQVDFIHGVNILLGQPFFRDPLTAKQMLAPPLLSFLPLNCCCSLVTGLSGC